MNATNQQTSPRLALTLGGGGARAAYQVGVLRAIARRYPQLQIPLLNGVSAGAINISHLANFEGNFTDSVDALCDLWSRLKLENVFDPRGASLLWRAAKVGMRLSVGLPSWLEPVHGMVDTEPLREYLHQGLHATDGTLPGIDRNIKAGRLQAVALTTNSYSSGDTVTFFSGRQIAEWERPHRKSVETGLTVEHIMASSALPLVFPPVRIDDDWYGDGGVRLVAPLAPAVHLGADRLLVISTHFGGEEEEQPPLSQEAPSPATVLAAMYNAVFLDQLDQDEREIRRITDLVSQLPPERRDGLREVKLFVIRPSQNLGALAFDLKCELPRTLCYLLDRFGASQTGSDDFLSTLMFHHAYIGRLIELGEQDGTKQCGDLQAFLESSVAARQA